MMIEAGSAPLRRVAVVSQCLGRIVPPEAHGSIATWTYETVRRLGPNYQILLIELGEQPFRTLRTGHGGLSLIYVPTALNRIANAVHSRVARLARYFRSEAHNLTFPPYASIWHNFGFIVQAAWHARRWQADVIHIHNFSQFVPVMRALNPKARIVLHMHCEWLSQLDPGTMLRRIQAASVIVGCGAHVIRKVQNRFPGLAIDGRVVYNGSDIERFTPRADHAATDVGAARRLLFVGRISPEKGVHLLVDAFVKIARQLPDVRLDFVGGVGSLPAEFLVSLSQDPLVQNLSRFYGCDYLAEVERRIPRNLKARVAFHGNVPHRDLPAHYANATIFVNPSLSDAFPLTIVEAMSAGVPVVASAVGGVREQIIDDVCGLLVAPDNAEALAGAICRLLEDDDLRERMATAARDRARRCFSWEAIAQQTADVYTDPTFGQSCN